mmetsp:Transcript_6327/g.16886  ORF Transcript_6327/g.16886 Transcript_6327/m.16886 type:complete len:216 (+) Transcript_6327:349-996(+)
MYDSSAEHSFSQYSTSRTKPSDFLWSSMSVLSESMTCITCSINACLLRLTSRFSAPSSGSTFSSHGNSTASRTANTSRVTLAKPPHHTKNASRSSTFIVKMHTSIFFRILNRSTISRRSVLCSSVNSSIDQSSTRCSTNRISGAVTRALLNATISRLRHTPGVLPPLGSALSDTAAPAPPLPLPLPPRPSALTPAPMRTTPLVDADAERLLRESG